MQVKLSDQTKSDLEKSDWSGLVLSVEEYTR